MFLGRLEEAIADLTAASAAVLSTGVWTTSAPAASRSAFQKLNIACIGTANRAAADIAELFDSSEFNQMKDMLDRANELCDARLQESGNQ